jgi:hypothetical protein
VFFRGNSKPGVNQARSHFAAPCGYIHELQGKLAALPENAARNA